MCLLIERIEIKQDDEFRSGEILSNEKTARRHRSLLSRLVISNPPDEFFLFKSLVEHEKC